MKSTFCILAFSLCTTLVMAQSQSKAKFNPKIGFGSYRLVDEGQQGGDRSHPVRHFGFDMILQHKGWMFIPGFHLYQVGVARENFELGDVFRSRSHANYGRIPLVFGYKLLPNSLIQLGAYGGANLDFFVNVQENDLNLIDENFNGVRTSLEFGAHALLLKHFTVDLHYDHGLNPLIKFRENSKARGWVLSAGVIF